MRMFLPNETDLQSTLTRQRAMSLVLAWTSGVPVYRFKGPSGNLGCYEIMNRDPISRPFKEFRRR